jgi:hypothetical protein
MKHQITFYIFCSLLLISCGGNRNDSDSQDLNTLLGEKSSQSELSISEETMNEIIQSLPSPLEIATLIRETGLRYNPDFLNSTNNAKLYSTDTEKALAMGIYSGDLGYINIYEKSSAAFNYLGTVKRLADDLMIGQFFDIETIKRIASNSSKIDSLLYISTMSFEKMDRYLRDQKRSKLSVLLVTGTWIESVYLATQVVNNKRNDDLVERIAEQKMILDQILLIVSAYEDDALFKKVSDDLRRLKNEYDKVTITYNYQEPVTKEINGRLVIIDNSTTEVNMSDEQLVTIIGMVEEIRNKMALNS